MPNWNELLHEIENKTNEAQFSLDLTRRKYLSKLYQKTQRNVIAYYSGWLSKPGIVGTAISDEDKNGFMMAVHKLDRAKGLDLILHTEGGSMAATESIVNYLRKMFGKDIRAVVPQIAMSGGTMIACSCESILMGKHSNLGPIDPHFNGIPAMGVLQEFDQALKEIKEDQTKIHIWTPIINKYMPTFLSQCKNAVERSKEFVSKQLKDVMFSEEGKEDRDRLTAYVVNKLSNYNENKGHDKHFHYEDCKEMGLVVKSLEKDFDDDLQDLILTVHHCFMHTIMNTNSYKMIENHLGVAMVRKTT